MLETDYHVLISSTTKQLSALRQAVFEAVDPMDDFSVVKMESFGARTETPAAFCRRMVAACDVVVFIVGHDFGSAPPGSTRSFTQLEYDAAKELDKDRLVFLSSADFPMRADRIESDDLRDRQRAFRNQLQGEVVKAEFRDEQTLAAQVVAALANWARDAEKPRRQAAQERGLLPVAPAPNIVHPYPIQAGFTGRIAERSLFTRWFSENRVPIHVVVAIGGMGKSSVTWTWLQEDVLGLELPGHAPLTAEERRHCALPKASRPSSGVFWWSFYEQEATFEAFVVEALRYLTGEAPSGVRPAGERVRALVHVLANARVLFVLDGFERILGAYASLAAAYQGDFFDTSDDKRDRACADPNAAYLLRALSSHQNTRLLITTRLYPSELDGLSGAVRTDLSSLPERDAIRFYRTKGINGTDTEIRAVCERYGRHPLALALLAGLIREDPIRPGDITAAQDYDPVPDLVPREHHVLDIAFSRLNVSLRRTLTTIAAFRFPMRFETMERIVNADGFVPGMSELVEQSRSTLERFHQVLHENTDEIEGAWQELFRFTHLDLLAEPRDLTRSIGAVRRGIVLVQLLPSAPHETLAKLLEEFAEFKQAKPSRLAQFKARLFREPTEKRRDDAGHLARCEEAWAELEACVASCGGWAPLRKYSGLFLGLEHLQSESSAIVEALRKLSGLRHGTLNSVVKLVEPIAREIKSNETAALNLKTPAKSEFKQSLGELIARGFIMFDRANRQFDLHPIVRQYAYDRLNEPNRVHAEMRNYFSALPQPTSVKGPADLAPTIELYHHTLHAGQRSEAGRLFLDRLVSHLFYQFGAYPMCIELLEALIPNDDAIGDLMEVIPHVTVGDIVSTLSHAYSLSGRTRRAIELSETMLKLGKSRLFGRRLAQAFQVGLADDLIKLGALQKAWELLNLPGGPWDQRDWVISNDNLRERRRIRAYTGSMGNESAGASGSQDETAMGCAYAALAQLQAGLAQRALDELAQANTGSEDGIDSRIWSKWLRGACLVALERYDQAGAQLDDALSDCRQTGLVELEAAILCERARWLWKTDQVALAREALAEAREIATRCEYRLQQADIHRLQAEIHLAAGEQGLAQAEATLALERAECDGGDFTYSACVKAARRILAAAEAPAME